ncbi:cytochrome c c1 heme [Plasmopara halstedii]|uniref:Holocytochrome c-type synthase n=1 Tax=Plasmopara halstedii TaxID=4781 RepID=A0A0P1ARE9_PLAHL|nr:cytochrome c c1 heme [Plasmopara halstedii]CEG43813.1 cytochrome c c1 heme [Plasmopara halstedii]|eukprot:XP_024580182.1 cytochrome c c1 heme [Plasmopara halstedii]
MGNQLSSPLASDAAVARHKGGCPAQNDDEKRNESCPVRVKNVDGCPAQHDKKPSEVLLTGGCPVVKDDKEQKEVYNVYGQRIDPTNMMPYNPNQAPNEEQRYPLAQNRVQSTIPKGGTEGTWLYPSEQMFFNALKRKGKGEDVHEGDVKAIVSIHNNMNERAWAQVEHYEKVCHPELKNSKLLKFCGRPDEMTPIAWMKSILGFGKPFDRHDWIILRSDNTQVRYVIDYYFDDKKSAEDEVPELHSEDKVRSISMYARPAVDSVGALIDRLKFPFTTYLNGLKGPNLAARSALVESIHEGKNDVESFTVEEIQQTFAKIKESCKSCMQEVRTCGNEIQCSQAALALQLCMGRIICPPQAAAFTKALEIGDETVVEAAFDAMNSNLEQFQERGASAMQEQAVRESLTEKLGDI